MKCRLVDRPPRVTQGEWWELIVLYFVLLHYYILYYNKRTTLLLYNAYIILSLSPFYSTALLPILRVQLLYYCHVLGTKIILLLPMMRRMKKKKKIKKYFILHHGLQCEHDFDFGIDRVRVAYYWNGHRNEVKHPYTYASVPLLISSLSLPITIVTTDIDGMC